MDRAPLFKNESGRPVLGREPRPVSDAANAEANADANAERGGATRRLTSAQIFGGALEVQIDHHGAIYRLKQTSLGKLILTK